MQRVIYKKCSKDVEDIYINSNYMNMFTTKEERDADPNWYLLLESQPIKHLTRGEEIYFKLIGRYAAESFAEDMKDVNESLEKKNKGYKTFHVITWPKDKEYYFTKV